MMTHEVWRAARAAPCDVTLYADRESQQFRDIVQEVALQRSDAFDPGTRVVPKYNDRANQPEARIAAHLTLGPDGDSITGQVVAREKNGNLHARNVTGGWVRFFFSNGPNAFTRALDDIMKELCGAGLSEISGTFTGSSVPGGRTSYRWNGSVVFKRAVENIPGATGQYLIESGFVTFIASGLSPTAACQVSGTEQIALQPRTGSMGVFGTPPDALEPYNYSISVPFPYPGTMDVIWSSCAEPSYDGTHETISVGGAPLSTGQTSFVSDDGLVYRGSYSDPNYSTEYSWNLEGH